MSFGVAAWRDDTQGGQQARVRNLWTGETQILVERFPEMRKQLAGSLTQPGQDRPMPVVKPCGSNQEPVVTLDIEYLRDAGTVPRRRFRTAQFRPSGGLG